MVTKSSIAIFLLGCLFVLRLSAQDYVLNASVDRPTVNENESFTYILHVQSQVNVEPDLSPLSDEFEILQRSRNTSIQMINGATSQLTEWRIQLMPLSIGDFVIPSIQLAGASSNPVAIEVLPAVAGDTPGEIFLEVEIAPSKVYVQSQVIYTLRLFRAVNTGRSSLTTPEIAGVEAIIVPLGEDREYRTLRNDRDFVVLERQYAIFPQVAGELTIEPVTFEAVVITASGLSSLQRFRSGALDLFVENAVAPPQEYPDASWLPASALTLSEEWSDDPEQFNLGVPQTRTLLVEAEGLLETQLPELSMLRTEGVRQYADQPELNREMGSGGIYASRTERFAVIAQSPGEITIPAVELPWFNVVDGVWEVASLNPRVSMVFDSESTFSLPSADQLQVADTELIAGNEQLWKMISAVLLGIWLLTLAVFRFGWIDQKSIPTKKAENMKPNAMPNQSQLLRGIRAACAKNDPQTARDLLLDWAEKFVVGNPRTLGHLASQVSGEFSEAISALEKSLYGPDTGGWNGASLANALKGLRQLESKNNDVSKEVLQPLYK
ncbi:MAG: hypothetical protein CMM56_09885 [Rhodospirillaceae bacterium]|nr:hypothetical protein [Rhodospirillaceae bacterium]|tara:strand:+ start:1311 stop:2966 length:1656 start_codon:yes stop_codon:yes gene_type:complete